MPIIIQSEKKTTYARLIVLMCYTLLIIGGITMVVPFLLMVSGSFKGKVDRHEYDIIPAFLYQEKVLFQRYIEEKYNDRIQDYQIATGDYAPKFQRVTLPELPSEALVNDWESFCAQETTFSMYHLGAMTSLNAAHEKITPKNQREFRYYMRDICDNDIEIFQSKYSPKLKNWFYLETQIERLLDRNYMLPTNHNLSNAINQFKTTRSYHDRIYLSVDGEYRKKCLVNDLYKRDINKFNEINGTSYNSFDDIVISAQVPQSAELQEWEKFVRKSLHTQFINISADALGKYFQFLKDKYEVIENLNKIYKTNYTNFDDVPFPDDRVFSSPRLIDFALFVKDEKWLEVGEITLDTPELRWRSFLKSKHPFLSNLKKAHNQEYLSYDKISMPQKEMDYYYMDNHSFELRYHFLTRNYKMVIDYVSVYGRGIINTIIYCLLAIFAALTVNPLAAYALSRYNLPSQYKFLLFFITTVAFPAMVTMIPAYLLLKDLGLLNTFAALILPGLANGYSIFLLKGFFDSLPKELFEAADTDGASEWFKFWRITINLSKPILAVIALGAFMAAYGNFMYAFVLCQDSDMWTLMVWLYQLSYYTVQGVQFASLIVAAVPTLLVFIFAQRIIIRGIVVPVEK